MQDENMRNMKKRVLNKTKYNLFILNLNNSEFLSIPYKSKVAGEINVKNCK